MKIQCPACKEIVPIGDFKSSSEGIEVTCESCSETSFVKSACARDSAPPSAGAGREPGDGEMQCPKCGEIQIDTKSCRSCGLRVELFDDFDAAGKAVASDALQLLWDDVESNWDDDAVHERFTDKASKASEYSFAARRYREVLSDRPDDTRARDQLERVRRMAEATMFGAAAMRRDTPKRSTPYRNVIILFALLLVLAAVGGIYVAMQSGNQPSTPRTLDGVDKTRRPSPTPRRRGRGRRATPPRPSPTTSGPRETGAKAPESPVKAPGTLPAGGASSP